MAEKNATNRPKEYNLNSILLHALYLGCIYVNYTLHALNKCPMYHDLRLFESLNSAIHVLLDVPIQANYIWIDGKHKARSIRIQEPRLKKSLSPVCVMKQ